MSRPILLMVSLLVFCSCGEKANNPGAGGGGTVREQPAEVQVVTMVCPINGVHFPKGRGFLVKGLQGSFEVCSKGCVYQYDLAPEEYPDAGK